MEPFGAQVRKAYAEELRRWTAHDADTGRVNAEFNQIADRHDAEARGKKIAMRVVAAREDALWSMRHEHTDDPDLPELDIYTTGMPRGLYNALCTTHLGSVSYGDAKLFALWARAAVEATVDPSCKVVPQANRPLYTSKRKVVDKVLPGDCYNILTAAKEAWHGVFYGYEDSLACMFASANPLSLSCFVMVFGVDPWISATGGASLGQGLRGESISLRKKVQGTSCAIMLRGTEDKRMGSCTAGNAMWLFSGGSGSENVQIYLRALKSKKAMAPELSAWIMCMTAVANVVALALDTQPRGASARWWDLRWTVDMEEPVCGATSWTSTTFGDLGRGSAMFLRMASDQRVVPPEIRKSVQTALGVAVNTGLIGRD